MPSHQIKGKPKLLQKQPVPVRSFAKSGWFIKQWLANFTHSNRTGTWMSLNLRNHTNQQYFSAFSCRSNIYQFVYRKKQIRGHLVLELYLPR